jgi:hypothetical protein
MTIDNIKLDSDTKANTKRPPPIKAVLQLMNVCIAYEICKQPVNNLIRDI